MRLCTGFGHAVFEDFKVPDDAKTLAKQLRVGFFAQQHNLSAAGCRPDIDNDEEFSSYFWGAIVGRSRTGEPISGCDLDRNGTVSFAEAYAYAVVASNTIDIPLRTSDVVLRTYSRMASDVADPTSARPEAEAPENESGETATESMVSQPELFAMSRNAGEYSGAARINDAGDRHWTEQATWIRNEGRRGVCDRCLRKASQ